MLKRPLSGRSAGRVSQNGSGLSGGGEEPREPVFTGPWPALSLAVLLMGLYAWQRTAPDQDALFYRYGLIPLQGEEWERLVTSLFLHGGWAHVILNALGTLAFGAAVSRLFGTRLLGALAFLAFFLVCGAVAGWAYVTLKSQSAVVLIGASGGASGLMGGASRLLGGGSDPGRPLAPFLSVPVISMAAAWIIINLIVAVFGFAPGAGTAAVAWEAHLAGYAAGLFLVAPALWLLRGGRTRIDSRG